MGYYLYRDEGMSLFEAEALVEGQQIEVEDHLERNRHRDWFASSPQRELKRLLVLKELVEAGACVIRYGGGYAIIKGHDRIFSFSLLKQKWQAINPDQVTFKHAKRYRCKSPAQFVKKYVLEEDVD